MTTATAAKSDLRVEVAEQTIGIATHGIRRAWDQFRAYRATCVELNQLTDRQLADLGVARGSIKEIAHRAIYGK